MTDRELVIFATGIVAGRNACLATHDYEAAYRAAMAIRRRAKISSEEADDLVAELTSLVYLVWRETRRSEHDG